MYGTRADEAEAIPLKKEEKEKRVKGTKNFRPRGPSKVLSDIRKP